MPCGRADFFFLYTFFVWPSPTAAYNFKAIKQSINKTKLLLIDRLGEKAIIQSINHSSTERTEERKE